jgi:hypothetical protein
MASYFVDCHARSDGAHAVHDRSRCPPGRFPCAVEYLGEFLDAPQAVAVARLRYAHAQGCACCQEALVAAAKVAPVPEASALSPLRS